MALRLPLLKLVLFSDIIEASSAVGEEKVHDGLLVIVLRDVHRRLLLLILVVDVGTALLNEKLYRFVAVGPHCVVERGLAVLVLLVCVSSVGCHQAADDVDVTLSRGVEEGRLHVRVEVVHITAVLDEHFDQRRLTFPGSVVKSRLI